MAGRFVRSSKFRHVYGKPTRKEQCYDNLHISKNAWDSNIIKANPQYLSVNWESGGGGAFAVIPLSHRGRLPEQIPLFRGHTAPVLDTDWSPFNDSLIASGSDDGKVFIWAVPENFSLLTDDEDGPKDVEPISKLSGHQRKVGHVLFHPTAENVLATSSGDYTVKLWDISTGTPHYTLKHSEVVQSMSWSTNGSMLVTTCRDKKLRIWDPRQETAVHEVTGHTGAKNSRAVWMTGIGEDKIATTGFSKMSDRQLGLWDLRSLSDGPLNGFEMLDTISGVCMPFWDEGTKCIYLAGKGDGNIRYFEYSNDEFIFLSEYKSGDPQRGVAFLPKRGVAVHENEVMRAFKTVNDSYIEPISFVVPRRAETFQSDIYPETYSGESALTAEAWYGGADAEPKMFDMETLYTPESLPSSAPKTPISVVATTPAPAKTAVAPPKPTVVESANPKPASPKETPTPTEKRVPSPILVETTAKVADKNPEIPNPGISPTKPSITPAPARQQIQSPVSVPQSATLQAPPPTPMDTNIVEQLARITALLETQNKTLASQDRHISDLTKELDALKNKVDARGSEESSRKDEIIRKLELELEEARS
ncbi:uncharacterized protein H6S33_007771 [Morchella sextelata]|uniref:uncharacterized protein n=1 Tax=Morchella sextelata TaxID=1174677 RepID=UPI001D049B05|nr:uncharacterized protein H6S33_007771 [Morchella sextelata]KAH0603449.1 hypothetical protein H6S33_007771 [Morchella sextelata]